MKMYAAEEKEIRRLGDESGFFRKEHSLDASELGRKIKVYRYAPQTEVEKYEYGFIIWHFGNKKIYAKKEAAEVFSAARVLASRERYLNRLFS